MKTIRIIPRLDVKGHNLVKGVHLEGLRVLGLPERFSRYYFHEGADELIYIDMVASLYGRNNLDTIVKRTAENVFIPITVGGGIRSIDDILRLLSAGADKVAINTEAIHKPQFITDAAKVFGSQCIVISIQAMKTSGRKYLAFTDTGREPTGKDVFEWAKEAVDRGAGEILITSIDNEGTGIGYDIELVSRIVESVSVPVIACGGSGRFEDFKKVIEHCNVDAVSAASIFHYHIIKDFGVEKREEGNIEYLKDFVKSGGSIFKRLQPMSITELKSRLNRSGISCINLNMSGNTSDGFGKALKNTRKENSVALIDYGRGNLFNVAHALEKFNIKVIITDDPLQILSANKIIIAGVGAFGDGMKGLQDRGLISVIKECAEMKKAIMGICLGMQLFMDYSEEFGINKGLGLIKGNVVKMKESNDENKKVKIPHIKWNQININKGKNNNYWQQEKIFKAVTPGSFMYFVHSYIVVPDDFNLILAETDYGPNNFCSMIRKDNIIGCQFHPERSGYAGLLIYKNFLNMETIF